MLINNAKIEAIRNWIIEMNQFPKCLVFRHRKNSQDDAPSRKDSGDSNFESQSELRMSFQKEPFSKKTVKS